MANTYNEHNGTGSQDTFAYTFPYLKTTDVKVSVDGVVKQLTTDYTRPSVTTIQFNSDKKPANGAKVRIYRDTDEATANSTFYPGSAIKSSDLNDNFLQAIYIGEEGKENADDAWNKLEDSIDSTETWVSNNTKIGTTGAVDARVDSKINTELTNGSKNFNTSGTLAAGATTVTGNIAVSGTVDGRDVAADGTKLDGIESGATADQTNAEIRAAVEAASDSNVFTDADHSKLNAIEASATADQTVDEIKTLIAGSPLGPTHLAESYYTEAESDARYFNVSTGDTIKDGDAFPDNDTTIATTAAINDRIVDLLDDVGGFVPIANETSFPNANPDVNNGTGTLISIKALASDLTSNGSGVATIANGTVGNSTVTITGLDNSTTYAATLGMIVETTTTLNTYAFHRQVPQGTNVTTVAGSISNVNSVASNISNVNSVAGNASNINSAVSNASNINTVAGSISNVNTVGTNISSVNDFADKYRIASSAPSSNNDNGDLYYNTSDNKLYIYNGSSWDVATSLSNSGGTVTGDITFTDSTKLKLGTGSDLQVFHDGSHSKIINSTGHLRLQSADFRIRDYANDHEMITALQDNAVNLYYDGGTTPKFSTKSNGVYINGKALIGHDVSRDVFQESLLQVSGSTIADASISILNVANGTGQAGLILGKRRGSNGALDDGDIIGDITFAGYDGTDLNSRAGIIRSVMTADATSNSLYADLVLYTKRNSGGYPDETVRFKSDGNATFAGDIKLSSATAKILGTTADASDNGQININAGGSASQSRGAGDAFYGNEHGSLAGKRYVMAGNVAGGDIEFYTGGTVSATIANNGNATFGGNVTTGHQLTVSGTDPRLVFTDTNNNPDFTLWANGGNFSIYDETNSSARLTINSSGDATFAGNINPVSNNKNIGDGTNNFASVWASTRFRGGDGVSLNLGASQDFIIRHVDGTGNLIESPTGSDLHIKMMGGSMDVADQTSAQFIEDGAVKLYYDGSGTPKLQTTSTGVTLRGTNHKVEGLLRPYSAVNTDLGTNDDRFRDLYIYNDIDIKDDGKILLGNSDDFQVFHNSSDDTNRFYLSGKATTFWSGASNNHRCIKITDGEAPAVNLYYDGGTTPKLETTSSGVNVNGSYLKVTTGSASGGLHAQSNGCNAYIWAIQNAGNLMNGSTAGRMGLRANSGFDFSGNDGTSVHLGIDNSGNATFAGQVKVGSGGHALNASTGLEIRGPLIGTNSTNGVNTDHFKALKLALNDGTEWGSQALFSLGRYEEYSSHARSSLKISLGHGALNSSSDPDVDVLTLKSDKSATFAGSIQIGRLPENNLGREGVFFGVGGNYSTAVGKKYLIGFGYNSDFSSNDYPAVIGFQESSNSGNTKGDLIFATRDSTGATDAPIERFKIQSDGNATFAGNVTVSNTNPKIFLTDTDNTSDYSIRNDNGNLDFYDETNSASRLKIVSTGDANFTGQVNIGTTVAALGIDTGNNTGINLTDAGRIYLKANEHSEFVRVSGGELFRFRYGYTNGTTQSIAGTINITGTGSVAYNTSSDYRLKENEVAISDGITRLKTLKPYRFNFKAAPSKTVDGFFAHEVTPAVPEAITGEKDGTEMQGIDQSKLVPLLTAALQEAIAKIETLETKVAALESS